MRKFENLIIKLLSGNTAKNFNFPGLIKYQT